jgi:hypothetical protein
VPKQNRPFVRDGRLQTKKKRTDRSYLRPETETATVEAVSDEAGEDAPMAAAVPASPAPVAPSVAAPAGSLPSAVRAIQQQGARRRREVDVEALAAHDTRYALHELRRIAILAVLVIVTLIVLAIVMR